MWWRRKRAETLGQRGEALAAKLLKREGYRILKRNAWLGRFEIDIIAREGDTIAFVEVRTRIETDSVPPENTVGPTKRRRIIAAARRYIAEKGTPNAYYRFDVVGVIVPSAGKPRLTLYRNAFQPE